MGEKIQIYVKINEPHNEDPDPDSNLVFLDKNGNYYRVHSNAYNPDIEIESGWEIKTAIRKKIAGRVKDILLEF